MEDLNVAQEIVHPLKDIHDELMRVCQKATESGVPVAVVFGTDISVIDNLENRLVAAQYLTQASIALAAIDVNQRAQREHTLEELECLTPVTQP
jgi:hypothetical protein